MVSVKESEPVARSYHSSLREEQAEQHEGTHRPGRAQELHRDGVGGHERPLGRALTPASPRPRSMPSTAPRRARPPPSSTAESWMPGSSRSPARSTRRRVTLEGSRGVHPLRPATLRARWGRPAAHRRGWAQRARARRGVRAGPGPRRREPARAVRLVAERGAARRTHAGPGPRRLRDGVLDPDLRHRDARARLVPSTRSSSWWVEALTGLLLA